MPIEDRRRRSARVKPIEDRRRRSARETFANCRARYAAEYLHDVDNGSAPARRGTTYHRAKELYVSYLWKGRLTQDADLAQAALERARTELPLPFEEWLDVEAIWARWVPTFELNLTTFYSTEGAVVGFADTLMRLDFLEVPSADTLRCTDTKTHWRIPDDDSLRASFQTHFYLAAMRKLFPGFTHYQMVYSFDRFGHVSGVLELTNAELDAVEVAISESDAAMAKAEAANEFPASGGKHCGTCSARCELADHACRETVRLQSREEAEYAVSGIAAGERKMSMWREALRAYTEAHGPVTAGGLTWEHRPTTRYTYDLRDVVDVLKSNDVGLDSVPKTVFYAGATRLKALTGGTLKWSWLSDKIKALRMERTTTEFSAKSAASSDDDGTPGVADRDGNK